MSEWTEKLQKERLSKAENVIAEVLLSGERSHEVVSVLKNIRARIDCSLEKDANGIEMVKGHLIGIYALKLACEMLAGCRAEYGQAENIPSSDEFTLYQHFAKKDDNMVKNGEGFDEKEKKA